ncbi:hypothetical protein [Bradyrhizobium japonicum]|uniref:hypothetical protein n=1 Tax=Bradyrhizobium japonicum TaxID=375 RepID=UPI001BA6BB14|nr:hypothetical protein [Bradyrhizobium japonicum]MBR0962206.1 hypothetical protein [Bradyrhizobium japonicum]
MRIIAKLLLVLSEPRLRERRRGFRRGLQLGGVVGSMFLSRELEFGPGEIASGALQLVALIGVPVADQEDQRGGAGEADDPRQLDERRGGRNEFLDERHMRDDVGGDADHGDDDQRQRRRRELPEQLCGEAVDGLDDIEDALRG